MSALGARPALAGHGTVPPAAVVSAAPADSLPLRLATFTALAGFGAGHWAGLVRDPPVGRMLLVLAVVVGGAATLAVLGRTSLPRRALLGAAAATALLTVLLALMAAGLPLRLLWPSHWTELGDGLHRGLEGVQSTDWPYQGPDEWVRLTILLGAPLLLAVSAVLAFFPVARGARFLRMGSLVLLLVLYGTAVTEHDPGAPLLRGLVLLGLVGAWLWLPRLALSEALGAAGVVAAVGLLSVPVAASFDADQPWWNYRDWELFGNGQAVTFDWTHTYGPLDWPRNGATLLNIKSSRAHYWKVETLDGFDGFRWLRTPNSGDSHAVPGLPDTRIPVGRKWDYFEYNKRWDSQFRVTVRSLSSDLIVGAGITYRVDGAGPVSGSGDGTTTRISESPLERGDSYTVRAYAPDPTAAQMRGAPGNSDSALLQYTDVLLPGRGESALDPSPGAGFQTRPVAQVPLRDSNAAPDPDTTRALEASRYARTYRLASRITAGQPTTYDAVKAMEDYLQRNYRYSERPPSSALPLEAFLFEDKIGYCQQFSGAMALMLRLEGIPARVAAGFSPGSYNRDTGEYRVRDLDAHSWVEVWFNGIGWVPFDPTPAAAPAESQSSGLGAVSAAGGAAGEVRSRSQGDALSERAGGAGRSAGDPREAGRPWWILVLVPAAGGAGWAAWVTLRRRRRLSEGDVAEAQVAELRSALVRLGFTVPAATTLLALERRLARIGGPASARYAAGLRAHRYDPGAPDAPRLSERRAVRKELTARGGPLARLRGLRAIPPAGPRPL